MRKLIKITCLALVFLFVVNTTLPAMAGSSAQFSGEKILKIGVASAVVIGVVCLIRSSVVKGKAEKLSRQGDAFAVAGDWEQAVQAYTEAYEIRPKDKNVAAKLKEAKAQAGAMLIRLGDEARQEEKLEAAQGYYRQALRYLPASSEARQKLDTLSQDLALVYYRRGLNYESVNRWVDALREFEQAYLLAPQNTEIASHYQRAKAEVNHDLPLKAVLFFLNNTNLSGMEDLLTRELQTAMVAAADGRYVMLDYNQVRAVMTEQASALSATLNEGLALDIGRLLGVEEVIIGTLNPVAAKNRLRVEVTAKSLAVPSGRVRKEVKPFTYIFPKGTDQSNWWYQIPAFADELAKRLNK
jgi:tetratricopeptide (TPR) repeat protein